MLSVAAGAGDDLRQKLEPPGALAYHDNRPTESLPATLEASQFERNRAAFVAYTLASHTAPTLYQLPCYCPCNKREGHKSLLDCFTSRHGVLCRLCQKEVVYSFLQQEKGKTPAQIRHSIPKNVPKMDLDREVERLYAQLRSISK